jgi:glycosyltransferase involved in cell wall biosynthesis
MKPLITALVDTYNQERYIEQALVSVVEQGLSPAELEIIVVDDGSTDSTQTIVQKFLPRIKYLRKKNGGQASAFNAGFAQSHGGIISILDGDDWWAKGKLEAVADHLERNPEDLAVSHAYYEVHEKTGEARVYGPKEADFLHLGNPEAARHTLAHWSYLQPSALTVRRKLLEMVMPIPEVLVFCADSPIATTAMAMGARVLPQALSYYRIHAENLYAGELADPVKLRRRLEMDDVMYGLLYGRLLRLGVAPESVSILLDHSWAYANRRSLSIFGGSRLKTYRTEMRAFRAAHKNPTFAYYAFKCLVMVPATLLLPPRLFYKARDWYSSHNLGRVRDQVFKMEATPRIDSEDHLSR